ncbi:hypothetical protein TanjilG_13754 [Lupinus angustifolius]|uniref:Uncharacterized protein n=1 Tax=Lupinus angustifolius TaxID=3871 RepID=A0A1J7HSW6_LUPAN|nr:hypothetical protein TanjilG_13754 [Lupinus angustifolius]
MQGWFSGQNTDNNDDMLKPSSSLLADWNSYSDAQSSQDSSNFPLPFDIESAVRSANDTVSGTFSVAIWLSQLGCRGHIR